MRPTMNFDKTQKSKSLLLSNYGAPTFFDPNIGQQT